MVEVVDALSALPEGENIAEVGVESETNLLESSAASQPLFPIADGFVALPDRV